MKPLIITITGPSASGKTVLSKLIVERGDMEMLVSTTTRLPREGEAHGVDYYFIKKDEFERGVENGKFIENIEYNGVLYGVSAKEATRSFNKNKPAVIVAEPVGVGQIESFSKENGWCVFKVFVDNPESTLISRLLNRLIDDTSSLTGVKALSDEGLDEISKYANELNDILNQKKQAFLNDLDKEKSIEQYLLKFVEEYTKAPPRGVEIERKIKDAASRLKSFEFEQQNWVIPARENPSMYELVTDKFNSQVQEKVIEDIIYQARKYAHDTQKTKNNKIKPK